MIRIRSIADEKIRIQDLTVNTVIEFSRDGDKTKWIGMIIDIDDSLRLLDLVDGCAYTYSLFELRDDIDKPPQFPSITVHRVLESGTDLFIGDQL